MAANAQAWNFVLANMDKIEGICRRVRGADDQDFVQEVMAEIVVKFDTWDRSKSPTGSSFIWWKIRRVHTRNARQLSKTPLPLGEGSITRGEDDSPRSSIEDLADSGMVDTFKQVQLKQALESATEGQLHAAHIIAEGLSGEEVQAQFGVTRQSAINRIGRLGAKFTE